MTNIPVLTGLSFFTLTSDIFIVLFVAMWAIWLSSGKKRFSRIIGFFSDYGMVFAFLVALTAVLGSSFFSEVAGLVPCKLCWYERIFIYPQLLILAIALYYKLDDAWRYVLSLSVLGAVTSVYHYYLQLFPPAVTFCSANSLESCSDQPFVYFGYVTIPVMSFTSCILLIIFVLSSRLKNIK